MALQDPGMSFKHRVWTNFSIRQNLEYLLSGDWAFDEEPELITKAISAWVTTKNRGVRKSSILLQMSDLIADPETAALTRHGIRGALILRATAPSIGFLEHAYFPLGGMRMLRKASSPSRLVKQINACTQYTDLLIEFMRVLHYFSLELRDSGNFKNPSLKDAGNITPYTRSWSGLSVVPNSRMRGKISKPMKRAAFLYAANSVNIPDSNVTMLQAMRTNSLSYVKLQPVLVEWLQKANFIIESLIAALPSQTWKGDEQKEKYDPYKANRRSVPKMVPMPFSIEPPLSDRATHEIRQKLRKKSRNDQSGTNEAG